MSNAMSHQGQNAARVIGAVGLDSIHRHEAVCDSEKGMAEGGCILQQADLTLIAAGDDAQEQGNNSQQHTRVPLLQQICLNMSPHPSITPCVGGKSP